MPTSTIPTSHVHRPEALVLTCSYCGAPPSHPCTTVDRRGRRAITYLHLAREIDADTLHDPSPTHYLTPPPPIPPYRPGPPLTIDRTPPTSTPPSWTPPQPTPPDPASLPFDHVHNR